MPLRLVRPIKPNKYDVIVVLAGGIKDDGSLPDSVKYRLQKAQELYKQGTATQILMSGKWSLYREKHRPLTTEAEAMRQYAHSLGIPQNVILKEEESLTTLQNLTYCKTLFFEPNQWRKIVIVTSDFHIKRVGALLNDVFQEDSHFLLVPAKSGYTLPKKILVAAKEILSLFLHKRKKSQN